MGGGMTDQAVSSIPVLVVDDEDMIVMLVGEALRDGGYTVETATSPQQAITALDQKHTEYRAVITDVNMGPGRPTGWDVARHARELSPDIPVVYMTGDSGAEWAAYGVPNSILLVKPFAPAQVVTAISHLINAGGPGPLS